MKINIGPCLRELSFCVANWTKTAIEPDSLVIEGSLWQTFEKMAYRHCK